MVAPYRVDVVGRLPDSASAWLGDLGVESIERTAKASVLVVADQAALVGLLNRIHGLGMVIEAVTRPELTES